MTQAMLLSCCTESIPALILIGTSATPCHARFARIAPPTKHGPAQVIFRLQNTLPETTLSPLSLCATSFARGSRMHVFASALADTAVDEERMITHIGLELPAQISTAECRRTFRIPILPEYGVRAQLWAGSPRVPCPAEVSDISMAGVGLELQRDATLSVGQECELRMRHEEQFVRVGAVVRAVNDKRVGLFFPDSVKGEVIDPPVDLRDLVTALERRWLRDRGRD